MTLLAASAAALALVAPGTDPPLNRPLQTVRVAQSLRIAQAYWQRPLPCRVRVYAASQASLQNAVSDRNLPAGARLLEGAQEGLRPGQTDCSLWIDSDLLTPSIEHRVTTCTVIVHGIGHAYGLRDEYQHPRSVMSGLNTPIVEGCYQRFVPRNKRAWWRQSYGRPVFATRPTLEALQ